MKLSRLIVSVVAACALVMGFASSAVADTASHFPEGVSSPGVANACAVLLGTPAVANTGSATGFGNKVDLYVDACLGGP